MQNNFSVWNLSSTQHKIKTKPLKYPGRSSPASPTQVSSKSIHWSVGDSGSSPHSEPGKHWLESGSPTSQMSVLTTKLGWSSSSCFTPPWIWWHFYWNRYICVKEKKKAQNSGTTLIRKITSRYLESARIWIFSSILKMGKNMMLTLFEGPH